VFHKAQFWARYLYKADMSTLVDHHGLQPQTNTPTTVSCTSVDEASATVDRFFVCVTDVAR